MVTKGRRHRSKEGRLRPLNSRERHEWHLPWPAGHLALQTRSSNSIFIAPGGGQEYLVGRRKWIREIPAKMRVVTTPQ